MGANVSGRKKTRVFTIDELVAFCNDLNGNRKHDHSIGLQAGLTKAQVDILRAILGKVEYNVKDISDDVKQDIVDEYAAGTPVHEIAVKYGFRWDSYVYNIVKQFGVDVTRKPSWTFIQYKGLLDMKERKQYKWKDVAQKLCKSMESCICKYKELNSTKWSDVKVSKLIKLRDEEDLSWDKIGFALVKHPNLCKAKYEEIKNAV